jgi:hypothetical protein
MEEGEILKLFERGYWPRVKKIGGRRYITLRTARRERSLGPYSDERWRRLQELYQRFREERAKEPGEPREIRLTTRVTQPKSLPYRITIETKTLLYYEWARSKGYEGDLGEVLKEVCQTHFLEKQYCPLLLPGV